MAAKRYHDETGPDPDQRNQKRMRARPSLSSVIGEVLMSNFLHNFCSTLEPMLRKVVNEEVEHGLRRGTRALSRSSSLRIQALEPSSLKLIFTGTLSLPTIFTGSKILDAENNPLGILLVDTRGDQVSPATFSSPIKVEIVVLDGDFPPGDCETWTAGEFEKNRVKERTGKRPLLTGDLQVTLKDGYAAVGEIEFTDNSSWIRSRRFRLGARVVQGSDPGVWIREAMTEAFVVKDHRGELYKKHHPPMLEDEVWRLEKIGKEGAFHRKLTSEGINTVQDFLKLSVVDPSKLRKALGPGMSERMWEVALKHAKTCVMGSKLYIFKGPNYTLFLNPICQVVKAVVNDQIVPPHGITSIQRVYIEGLVRDAYANWRSLDEIDGFVNENMLLTQEQGDLVEYQYPNQTQTMVRPVQQHEFISGGSMEMVSVAETACNYAKEECNEWVVNSEFCSPAETSLRYNFSETSSDGDLTPSRSFFL